jgi:hypothetical protein
MRNFLLQKLFLDLSWYYLGSFSVRRSRRRRRFCLSFRVSWPLALLSRQLIMPHLCLQNCQRSFCCPVLCWSATTACSRRCRRCMMGRFWFWKGLYIFSRFRLGPGSKQSQLTASNLATPHEMYRPPNRRAEVVRRTPPRGRCHASLLAFQPGPRLQLRIVADGSHSPARFPLPVRRHPCVRRLRRPTEPPACAARQPGQRATPPKNQHTEL